MKTSASAYALTALLVAGCAAFQLTACGGGGGGGGSAPPRTTINGNLVDSTAFLLPPQRESRMLAWLDRWSPIGLAWAQATGAQVCIESTTNCTTTDSGGAFTLLVDSVLTNPCLEITATDFDARVCLTGVFEIGSTISVQNVTCSVSTGSCDIEDVDVSEPSDVSPSEPSAEDVSDPSEPSVSSPGNDPSDVSADGPDDPDDPSPDDAPDVDDGA